ncbi:hypothetical protein HYV88_02710 [Candidatus Woesearchaeota archaeon]|nr:hypothetical protein [Candidatus Woesearchaeota archaeon]
MKLKKTFGYTLFFILIISTMTLATSEKINNEIDFKVHRDKFLQNKIDSQVLSNFADGNLFVFAKNMALGFNDPSTGAFWLIERDSNYIFESEKIRTKVFVRNPSGARNVYYVAITIGVTPGVGNDIETLCLLNRGETSDLDENIVFNPETDGWYDCEFTIEPPDSMYGEYFITAEARILDGSSAIAENMNLYYFINPVISVSVDGDLVFDNVNEGESYLSGTILVGNDVDSGSGVPLKFYISGTDFYDYESSSAICPTSNVLSLQNLKYSARIGGHSTDFTSIPNSAQFDLNRITLLIGDIGVPPGGEANVVFKLNVPDVCIGNFNSGSIYFWAKPADNSPYAPATGTGIGISITPVHIPDSTSTTSSSSTSSTTLASVTTSTSTSSSSSSTTRLITTSTSTSSSSSSTTRPITTTTSSSSTSSSTRPVITTTTSSTSSSSTTLPQQQDQNKFYVNYSGLKP